MSEKRVPERAAISILLPEIAQERVSIFRASISTTHEREARDVFSHASEPESTKSWEFVRVSPLFVRERTPERVRRLPESVLIEFVISASAPVLKPPLKEAIIPERVFTEVVSTSIDPESDTIFVPRKRIFPEREEISEKSDSILHERAFCARASVK